MSNPNPSPELLPCPFCGGEAVIQLDRGRDTVGVGCTKCTACQPPSWDIASEAWARRAWNTRALSQTLPAPGEVERVRRAIWAYFHTLDEAAQSLPVVTFLANRDVFLAEAIALATVAAANDEGVARAAFYAESKVADYMLPTTQVVSIDGFLRAIEKIDFNQLRQPSDPANSSDDCYQSAGRPGEESLPITPTIATVAIANDEAFASVVEAAAKIAESWVDKAFATDHENRVAKHIAAAIRLLSQGGGK